MYDSVLRCPEFELLRDTFHERHAMRGLVRAGHVPQYTEPHSCLKNVSQVNKVSLYLY